MSTFEVVEVSVTSWPTIKIIVDTGTVETISPMDGTTVVIPSVSMLAGFYSRAMNAASAAEDSEDAAADSAVAAEASASDAADQRVAAEQAATDAAASESVATTQAGIATTKASEASASASSASASATTATTKAQEASTSAATAQTAASAATTKASEAVASADSASVSATAASGSASTASTKASEASASASAAQTSATSSANSATAASGSASASAASASTATAAATTATTKASEAASSATSANTSALAASSSATSAGASADTATSMASNALASAGTAQTSANTATSKAAEAVSAAASAGLSETAAETAADLAQDWATKMGSEVVTGEGYSAKKHATDAASSASGASTSASQAATSASAASTSASTASTKASEASSSAGLAATSATTATTKAAEAVTSAANAATSATAAAGSATTASGHASATLAYRNEAEGFKNTAVSSASSATTSATNAAADRVQTGLDRTAAANSATAAASSEAAAATYLTQTQAARDATLAALDNFDDKYLGEYELDPALDNDGNALVSGALYFNPNSGSQGTMKVYNGTMWVAAYADLSGALVAAANLSDLTNIPAARANLGLGTAATTAASAYATAAQGAKADTALQPAAIGTTVQGYSSALQGTTASFTSAEKAKLAYISVTANVDLDTVVSTLAGKANTVHTHAIADITGLQTQLDTLASGVSGAAAGEHSHDIADVTGLQTALDGKVGTSDARLTDSREWSSATVDQAEAEAGTATTRRAWTSQRVRQAIASWWNSSASKTKLDGIETGATADQTPAEILTAIKTVDGTGSGLDADTLDGQEASAFAAASHTHAIANVTGLQTALDAKLALAGGTVTGPITLTNAANAIIVEGANNDVALLRVNTTLTNQYGFTVKYMGSRNGIDNSLSIFTDNSTGPAIEAWKMLQTGQVVMTSRPLVNTNLMIDAGNYTDYTVTKAGVGATGSWGISITGNAATVTNGVVTTGAYADPSWITSLNYTKLTGTVPTWNQSTTGNAATATKLATARTLSLTGDVTGSVSFDGSANASITATVADDSHNHIISNVDGLQTALDAKVAISSIVDSLTSTVTNVPLSAAQGKVLKDSIDAINALLSSDNLSLDSLQEVVNYIIANRNTLESLGIANISGLQAALDGKVSLATAGQTIAGQLILASGSFADQLKILRTGGDFYAVIQYANDVSGELGKAGFNQNGDFVLRHGTNAADDWKIANGSLAVGTVPGARVSGNISGNAATATKLATARTITLSGDVSGSVTFDGSANVSITSTVADDSHNHVIGNVDGLQAALDSITGSISNVDNTSDLDKPISTATGAALNGKIDTSKIVDNLSDASTDHVLSARQGLVLKGYIDTINSALASDESTLDTLQEVVDFIQINRADLDSLGISSIAGLTAALDAKYSSANFTAGTHYLAPNGNGSGLTSLNASAFGSGTMPVSRGGTGATNSAAALTALGAAAASHTHSAGDLPVGSTSAAGLVQLQAGYATASDTLAATAGAVKSAYDTLNSTKQAALTTVSQAEAEAGTSTTSRIWTAERVKQAIEALAPAGGGVGLFTAAGTITAGAVVQLRTSDAGVEQVVGQAETLGSASTFKANYAGQNCIKVVGNTVVISYRNTATTKLEVVAGTVSGSAITFGTPVVVTDSYSGCYPQGVDYDPVAGKFLVVGSSESSYVLFAVVVTVSGTTCSVGSVGYVDGMEFNPPYGDVCYDPVAGKFLVVYTWFEPYTYSLYEMRAKVGTISGTSVSFGSTYTPLGYGRSSSRPKLIYHPSEGKFLLFSRNNSQYGILLGMSVSGTVVSWGSPVNLYTTNVAVQSTLGGVYDPDSGKIVLAISGGPSSNTHVVLVSMSGTTVTRESPIEFTSDYPVYYVDIGYNSARGKLTITYRGDTAPNPGKILGATVDGSSVTFDPESTFYSSTADYIQVSSATDSGHNIVCSRESNSNGVAYAYAPVSTNLEKGAKVIGVSQATVADGADVPVKMLGAIDEQVSGLTTNTLYYVSESGSLTTSSASPNVLLGKAVAATKLLITVGE